LAINLTDRSDNTALPYQPERSKTMQANQVLDARGLNCPLPILRTKKALSALQSGDTLKVVSTDPGSVKDMISFCTQTGNTLLSSQQAGSDYEFVIHKI
jgi:tRNA 2-thiouridine synthesizing protein A